MDQLRFIKAESDLYRFDGIETMISAVQARPIIWDWSCPRYKNRKETKIAWEEVCREVRKNYDDMDKSRKEKFGSIIMNRWNSVRTRYRQRTFKGKQSNYAFSDHLRFLDKLCDIESPYATKPSYETSRIAKRKKLFQSRPATTRSASIPPPPPPAVPHIPPPPPTVPHFPPPPPAVPHIPPPPPAVPLKHSNETGHQTADRKNALLSFFKGLLPTVANFSPKETLDMQMEVLNAIRSIRRKRHNPASCVPHDRPPSPTSPSCHPTQPYQNHERALMQYFLPPQNQGFDQRLPSVSQPFCVQSHMESSPDLKEEDDSDFLEVIGDNGS